jgi:oligopeptide/dipeptide ABC transporter ATP-binding protein
LLFADEPTTALDVTVQAQILELLSDLRRDLDMAMMLVTHDLGVVANHTDYVTVLYAGLVVEQAPTRKLFASMKMPYTEALLKSIPRLDQPSGGRMPMIGGRLPDPTNPEPGCPFAPRCPYVQDRCRKEVPPLTVAPDGHAYRCFYPIGGNA